VESQIRTANSLAQVCPVEEIEAPANGLPVWDENVQLVEHRLPGRIITSRHHPVYGQGRDCKRSTFDRGVDDSLRRGLVI